MVEVAATTRTNFTAGWKHKLQRSRESLGGDERERKKKERESEKEGGREMNNFDKALVHGSRVNVI